MYTNQPINYKALITPYQQRLLQYGIDDTKIYLSEAANAVFRAFTNGFVPEETSRPYYDRKHAILDGGYIETGLDGTSLVQITLKPTTIIADHVLLVFPEDTTVDVDVENLDDNGEILVFLNFKYIQSVYENKPLIKALYYDGTNFVPDEFQHDRDSVILTRVHFEKNNGIVTKITSTITDPYKQVKKNFLSIYGNDIEIAPLASLWYRMLDGYQNIHTRRQEFTLDQSNWIQEIPDFDIGSTGIFYSAVLNIDIVRRKMCTVQCFLEDLMINPTAIQHIDDLHVKVWMPEAWATQENLPIMSVIVTG